jgi:23S rRNA-/tRNA-specific pseudouridylate synthase
MQFIEFQWLDDGPTKKESLQGLLNCSGQLLKKYFSSKELQKNTRAKELIRLPLDLVNHLKINPVFKGPRPSIIKENAHYLALHKPAGVHGHPLCYSDQDTLLNFLTEEGKWEALNVNVNHYDRGLLYRLDYETSGVILLAKEESYFDSIRNEFKDKMKQKLYLVVVDGKFDREGSWSHFFRATGFKGAKQKVSEDFHPDAQEGHLKVKLLSFKDEKSLLLVSLQTGLRHQIRAQLGHLGFPILGDQLYGGREASRLFLHAWKYEWDEVVVDPVAEGFDEYFDLLDYLGVSWT